MSSQFSQISERRHHQDPETPSTQESTLHLVANPLAHADLSTSPHSSSAGVRSNGHDPLLSVYFREINKFPLLTREQEAELAQRIRAGDATAVPELVNANLRFVASVAKKHVGRSSDFTLSDLISEGNIGLQTAAWRFDERRGFKFISYAVWWINKSIKDAIADNPEPLRSPRNIQTDRTHLNTARFKVRGNSAHEPSSEELREQIFEDRLEVLRKRSLSDTGMPPSDETISFLRSDIQKHWTDKRIADLALVPHFSKTCSLDDTDTGCDRPLVEILKSPTRLPNDDIEEKSLNAAVQKALERLSEKELKVVSLYYGLGGDGSMSLEAVGTEVGLTRERIRQIREKALGKLRNSSKKLLRDLHCELEQD